MSSFCNHSYMRTMTSTNIFLKRICMWSNCYISLTVLKPKNRPLPYHRLAIEGLQCFFRIFRSLKPNLFVFLKNFSAPERDEVWPCPWAKVKTPKNLYCYYKCNKKDVVFFCGNHKKSSGLFWTDHWEYKPPQVSVDRKVNHLLHWVEIWIIQVPQKPQHTWSKNLLTHTQTYMFRIKHFPNWVDVSIADLSEQKDEGSEVKDVNHADQPVEEHRGAWSRVKTLLSVL